ncbi:MCE family protein [Mycobacterium sp. 236(2023)]|uniref:MCE family protein n=1 Tax=Mycobacterium sp. 236(2023) TaxID=3038163 RepID=UPI00241538A2|nr:MCE family protein [Mycobacterium sp. 236(2023)]MDG4668066.1 MCE family protein [Mycobacterium sp. 236(2023)]
MNRQGTSRIPALWWAVILVVVVALLISLSMASFLGRLQRTVPVLLTADRAGLVMATGAKVKMRGVLVGRVRNISNRGDGVHLELDIDPDQVQFIPANIEAEIKATTAFGTKFVDLIYPEIPDNQRISAGQMVYSRNVSTEVNTVFETLVNVLEHVDPEKLNAVLTALAEGVRGQGQRIGEATTAANDVLTAVNDRADTVAQNWRSFGQFSDTYAAAADSILSTLDAAATTSSTISDNKSHLDALLLNVIGLSQAGNALLGPNVDTLVRAVNVLEPTTDLLMKYNPMYTCLLVGSKFFLDNGGYETRGGNGYSLIVDSGLLFGDDPYRYPQNLPIVAAKGGPGGKPGCGSLPDVSKNFPVRQLVTNTGWGTGLDIRPNPGIGHPFWINYFPVTRAVPEPPSVRGEGPPAIGPVPFPGAPPYGAPLYLPDGTPLYPPPVMPVPPPAPLPVPAPTDPPR